MLQPQVGFTKATVSAWRVVLQAPGLESVSINVRITAVRKLAASRNVSTRLRPAVKKFRELLPCWKLAG